MFEKIKDIYKKQRELILYVVFGALTTFVGWFVYFAILISGKMLLGVPVEDTQSATFLAIYTVAQVVQWIAAVLFAFFTNRKYVFCAEHSGRIFGQLVTFSGGRVATFFVDYLVTFFGAAALSSLMPSLNRVLLFGREWNLNEIGAKLVAAVIVVVANYFFSKFLVFKKKNDK